ncbi:MAG TPA: hypothetical protein VH682_28620 [Gemmataceae bacterium]|jgi:hypothetical protein
MWKPRGVHSGRQGKAGLVLLLGLAVWGCGRSTTATVSGHVRYQGAPLSAGLVIFYGPNHQVDNAFIRADGSYTATKVPLGAVKVAVTTPGTLFKEMEKARQKMGKKPSTSSDAKRVSLPARYHDPERSGLELTVTSGSQPFEIDLK